MTKKIVLAVAVVAVIAVGVVMLRDQPPTETTSEAPSASNADMIQNENQTPITMADVEYFSGAKGYFVRPEQAGNYPGVGHAFANPSGANYAPNETKDAWEKTLAFLKNNLSAQ